jgi:glycosyltransferase involved in cell wall biosynthesis
METQSYDTWRGLQAAGARVTLIHKGRHDVHHVWWIPFALTRMWHAIRTDRPDVVLLGDAFMNAMATRMLRVLRMPHATLVMGLDVTFDSNVYRKYVVRHLRAAPLIIAQSRATASAVRAAGVREDRLRVLTLAVEPPSDPVPRDVARGELVTRLGLDPEATVLLTLGRLVRRKGVAWFVSHVLHRMGGNWVYLIAGEGPAGARIEAAARRHGLQDRVRLLGLVPHDLRETLFRGSDLFVQPNIRVYGDMEGFGLVNVEAAVRDTPVLASRLEGIQDAIVDGETGWLVTSEDAFEWRERVAALIDERPALAEAGRHFGENARKIYSPQRYSEDLLAMLRDVVAEGTTAADLAPAAEAQDAA